MELDALPPDVLRELYTEDLHLIGELEPAYVSSDNQERQSHVTDTCRIERFSSPSFNIFFRWHLLVPETPGLDKLGSLSD